MNIFYCKLLPSQKEDLGKFKRSKWNKSQFYQLKSRSNISIVKKVFWMFFNSCKIYWKRLWSKNNFDQHIAFFMKDKKLFKWVSFWSQFCLYNYVAKIHEGTNPYKWEYCYFGSSWKYTLKTHVIAVHERKKHTSSWEKKTYKFEVCEYRCPKKYHLKKYVATIHELKKLFQCKICNYNFT